MKRAFVFLLVLLLLAGLAGGLGYFQFLFKPAMIRGIIAKSPQPVQTVAVAEVKQEDWVPRLPAIGTFRAVAGIDIAPEVGGVVTAIHFESGQDVGKGDPLVNIDNSVEQADLNCEYRDVEERRPRSAAPARTRQDAPRRRSPRSTRPRRPATAPPRRSTNRAR